MLQLDVEPQTDRVVDPRPADRALAQRDDACAAGLRTGRQPVLAERHDEQEMHRERQCEDDQAKRAEHGRAPRDEPPYCGKDPDARGHAGEERQLLEVAALLQERKRKRDAGDSEQGKEKKRETDSSQVNDYAPPSTRRASAAPRGRQPAWWRS